MATRRPARRSPTGDPQMVTELVRRLGALLAELGLSEIEASVGSLRVRVQRHPPAGAPVVPVTAAGPPTAPAPTAAVTEVTLASAVTIEAPMVGTFYRASSPTAEPYVREGDIVKEGQTLCIIEAMKLMNEIESQVRGRIVKILADNGQPVEYGQPLFVIEPLR